MPNNQRLCILSRGAHAANFLDQNDGARVQDKVIGDAAPDQMRDAAELLTLMAEASGIKAEEVRQASRSLGAEEIYMASNQPSLKDRHPAPPNLSCGPYTRIFDANVRVGDLHNAAAPFQRRA